MDECLKLLILFTSLSLVIEPHQWALLVTVQDYEILTVQLPKILKNELFSDVEYTPLVF